MLTLIEHPIAFNPSQTLFKAARQHNWTIVIERKDVVYQIDNIGSNSPSVAIIS
jgi:phosphoserine phosphatase